MPALAIAFVTLVGAVPVAVVGWLGVTGKLPPNWFAGIRTRYSLSSPERWYAVHRIAGPYLLYGGVAAVATGMAFAPFAFAGAIPDAMAIIVVLAECALVGFSALAGAMAGLRRARQDVG